MIKKIAITAAAVLLAATGAFAGVNPNAGIIFPELENGAGARAQGMGGAFTAVADDASAAYWNHAGLSSLKSFSATLTYDTMFMDAAYSNLIAAVPLGPGALGVNIFYMSFGSFENVDIDSNTKSGSVSPFTLAGNISYGISLGSLFSVGAGVKILNQSLGEISNLGFAGDAGISFKTDFFKAAITGRNIGAAGGFSLPMDVRLGLAVLPIQSAQNSLIISADAGYVFKDTLDISAGIEYTGMKTFSIRAGYKYRLTGNNLTGLTGIAAGAGLRLGVVGLDYAFVPFGELGYTHRLALDLDFGPAEEKAKDTKAKDTKIKDTQKKELTVTEAQLYQMFFDAGTAENSGMLGEAEIQYREMLKLKPDYAPALKRLGAVYFKQKKKAEAVKAFEEYIKLKPDDASVIKWLQKNK